MEFSSHAVALHIGSDASGEGFRCSGMVVGMQSGDY